MGDARRRELFEFGVATSLAMSAPAKLKSILRKPAETVEATGMIAIPKKKPSG